MSVHFEEIDFSETPIGELVLQRRRMAALGGLDVFEVKLDDEYLMSSLFTAGEVALADLGLGALTTGAGTAEVVVGGLGLGYTALAALGNPVTSSLLVVEFLEPVMDWHQRGLVPIGSSVAEDVRCRLVHGDFFASALNSETGFDPESPGRHFDAVLLDVDHTPLRHLQGYRGGFYERRGLEALSRHLTTGGVFALWSDEIPDDDFLSRMADVFDGVRGETIVFANPLTGGESTNGIYIGMAR